MRVKANLFILSLLVQKMAFGQDSIPGQKIIKDWDVSILPSFVYNTDKGIQYGALASIYYYDDSTHYPDYLYNLYLQSSVTTRGGHVDYLFFDSKNLLPEKLRLIADLSSVGNRFQQFYGFNGYDALYNSNYDNPSKQDFISQSYYYIQKLGKTIFLDVQRCFFNSQFKWDLGFGNYNITIHPSKNKFEGITTDSSQLSLYEKYVTYGIIPAAQKNGGNTSYLKGGLIYDTRDNEAIPTKGIWAEGVFIKAPKFLKNDFAYSQIVLIFRQYFTLRTDMVFAYRIAYQTKLNGAMPFYMMPYFISTFHVQEALGGVKTLRGILNDRLQGEGFALGNFEYRYTPVNTTLFERNLSIAFILFTDLGKITKMYNIDKTINMAEVDYKPNNEKIHQSVGSGIRFIVNHNFIVSSDYGMALNKSDGNYGYYLAPGLFILNEIIMANILKNILITVLILLIPHILFSEDLGLNKFSKQLSVNTGFKMINNDSLTFNRFLVTPAYDFMHSTHVDNFTGVSIIGSYNIVHSFYMGLGTEFSYSKFHVDNGWKLFNQKNSS